MLPVDYSEVGTIGDNNGQAFPVPGMASTDVVLAVMAWDPTGGDPIGIDPSEATAGTDEMTLSTTDTTDLQVWVMWCRSTD